MAMSSLQMGLVAAGSLVLVIMIVHSVWSARKNHPRQARLDEKTSQSDIVRDSEPELDAAALDVAKFPLPTPEKKLAMDPLIDVLAPLKLDGPIMGEAVLAALPKTRRVGSKPFSVEGFNATTQRWEIPVVNQSFTGLQAGVQLANRSGALNDIEYSEFVSKTQTFCDAVNATPDFPDMREEVARARELDQFASDHDAQLVFVLRALNAAWSPGYVQQNVARLGFVSGVIPGRMVIAASVVGLPPLLTLSFDMQTAMNDDSDLSAIREISISLDVAQVDRNEKVFARMREAALTLADSMEGVVTDDNGIALSPESMDVIGTELERLYDTLDQRDLSAGSALARRLFS